MTTITFSEQPLYFPRYGLAARPAKAGACGDAVEQFCDCFGNAHLLLCDGMGVGREQPLYFPRYGLAARPAKAGACGDAVEQFCDCFGNAHLLLCDGMGVGRPAAIDGTLAATLAARLLKAGFGAQSAARLVNVALALKSDEESAATMDLVTVDLYSGRASLFKAGACPTLLLRGGKVVNVALALKSDEESAATMDLVTVDLYSGRASLFKAGACPTLLLRGGKAQALEGSSLPVGILEQVVGQQDSVALNEGDWVVLVSDGALTDGSGWLCQQLELCAASGNTPQQTAELLADMAQKRAEGRSRPDDISVAVLRLERVVN